MIFNVIEVLPENEVSVSMEDVTQFSVSFAQGIRGAIGPAGATGPQGIQGIPGLGVPAGGTTGQVLSKNSNTNYDTIWSTVSSGGGTWGTITGTLSAQTDLQAALNAKEAEINVLQAKVIRTTRFASIASGTTGTITLPANSTVVLDDFGGTVDAQVAKISGGRPLYDSAVTPTGVMITATLDASGNYVLSGAPSFYPVALVYRVQQTLLNFDSGATNIVGSPQIKSNPAGVNGSVQYNSGGAFSSDTNFSYNSGTLGVPTLFVLGAATVNSTATFNGSSNFNGFATSYSGISAVGNAGLYSEAFGYGATGGACCALLGNYASSSAHDNCIAIGYQALGNGIGSIAIGYQSYGGPHGIAFGTSASNDDYLASMAFGSLSTNDLDQQVVFGSTIYPIAEFVIGNGADDAASENALDTVLLRASHFGGGGRDHAQISQNLQIAGGNGDAPGTVEIITGDSFGSYIPRITIKSGPNPYVVSNAVFKGTYQNVGTDPTTLDIEYGEWCVWKDSLGVLYLYANDGGTLKKVALI